MPDPLELTPLATVSADAITELFLSDPSELTDPQLDTLVRELRRRRSEFLSAEAAKAAKGKKGDTAAPRPPKPTQAEAAKLDKPASEIELGDIFT